ncbi:MAG: triose-phosphate isomerase [Candidatus Pacebacteria bacterium]|jgi:triosephosphate isomerase|nr:triose-phosphate isomerase [Candidatus Paceibacterota bacterium]MDD3072129.1 triose-phosphate isomerase [Candidatus Paceibacterota bacterium]MDD3728806.1 triose-phosphate isomerase [Candidatus Paceibacterota bacterium]MDD4201335.1 triose-phosphate isomerase [Candidatus Paceibacterota bacterium]MDD4897148.1 triose-phosphate isomerase [Candidatus Paceibacterota bacterium]
MKKIIIANFKCNPKSLTESKRIFELIKKTSLKAKKTEIVVCPSFVHIPFLKGLSLGAQNCFYEDGPYTGEVSASMLKDFGCKYVIVGHSERRRYFNEKDDVIKRKIKAVLENKMIPVLCVGETLKEKENGKTKSVIKKQIMSSLKGVSVKKAIIAYEPVWAIGTGNSCSLKIASEIRLFISNLFDTKIIYGGSVNGKNAKDYLEIGFDGLLVGKASLNPGEIEKMAD